MKQTPYVTSQVRRLVAELRRDRRRLVVLSVLLLVGVVLVARAAVSSGPLPAQASVKRSQSSAVAPMDPPSNSKQARADYISGINRNLTRDIFRPSEKHFPLPPVVEKAEKVEKKVTVMLAPTTAPSRDDEMAREQIRQHQMVLQEAKALKLQSIMMIGSRATASINGNMLSVGDEIQGFQITGIELNRCTVVKHGLVLMLVIDE